MTIHYRDISVKITRAIWVPHAKNCKMEDDLLHCELTAQEKFPDGSGYVGLKFWNVPLTDLTADNGLPEIFCSIQPLLLKDERKENYMTNLPSKKELESKTLSELTAMHNRIAGKTNQVKKFRDKPTAIARLQKIFNNTPSTQPLSLEKESTPKARSTKPMPKISLQGRTSPYAGKKIKILVDKNPRREGTAGHGNWSLYKNGLSYEEFRAIGGGTEHLRWDVEHGYIEMVS